MPHVTIGHDAAGKPITTADEFMVDDARRSVRGVRYLENYPGVYERHRQCMRLLDAHETRMAEIKRLGEELGWSEACDRHDALWSRVSELSGELLRLPAPDGQAVMWKVQELYTPGDGLWSADMEEQTHADLRRLLVA